MCFIRRISLLLLLSSVATTAFAGATARSGALFSQHMTIAQLGRAGSARYSMGVAYSQYLWPRVNGVATVYYVIDSNSADTGNINTAIAIFNADFPNIIQWVPWNSSYGPNYVDINLSPYAASGQCETNEGYEAIPAQSMTGAGNCTVATILHEMGHVIGLWHEQSRPDSGAYITENYSNAILGSWGNFAALTDNVQLLTPYDYASVMQYPAFSFSRNGGPAIESIPAGIPLGGSEGVPDQGGVADYSAADKEAIERLYGAAPTQVTITSNPVGLQVIVDGVTITTPQQFNWELNSSHVISVAAGVQTLTGNIQNSSTSATFYYTYGRWNDSVGKTHIITIAPGNGSLAFPKTSPQVATYSANFIQLVPYTASVYPDSTGAVSVSPTPQTYSGASGNFFVARTQATLTATPTLGWNFYEFNNAPFWLPGGLGANPKTFYVPDTGNPVDTTVEFSNTPIFTVDVSPDPFSSNMYAYVDGSFWSTPKNFSAYYDPTWTFGSTHNLGTDTPIYPYSSNSRYVFTSWSDGGDVHNHDTAPLPGSSTSYIATFQQQFAPATNFSYPPCGGSATISPASATNDGFYNPGQQLTFNASPDSGWTFAGWTYDLTGTANLATLSPSDESLVFANFNTTGTPLTLTGVSPAAANAGQAGFTLTLTGTGFTADSLVSVNGIYRTVTFVNSTELQVQVDASDVASPTAFQIFVENFPTGSSGCAVFGYQTFIVEGAAYTAQTITFPTVTGSLAVSTQVALTATASSGLPVTYQSVTPSVCTVSGSTASLIAYGYCTIQAMQYGDATYSAAPAVTQTFHVNHIAQTIAFPAIGSQLVNTQVALGATASSGFPVSYTSLTPSVCTVSGSTASLIAAGTCSIQAAQAGNGVYTAAPAVKQSFTVTLPTQTITFPTVTGSLEASTQVTLAATANSGLAVSYASATPSVCTVSGSTASLLVYGYCTIKATQPGNSSYAPATPVVQTFHVNHVAQTITFPAIGSQLANTQVALGATASSGLAVSYTSLTPSVCTVSGSTASLIAAGTCSIQAAQAGNGVYTAAPTVKQSFAVSLPAQTITFPTVTGSLEVSTQVTLTATASSGLSVGYASATPSVCTVSGSTASLIAYGYCTIKATQAGNSSYAPATPVVQTFHVNHVAQTITFPAIGSQLVNTQIALGATASSGLAVSYTSLTSSVCTVSGSTASLIAAGTCSIQATQAGSSVYSPAPPVTRSFAVTH